MKFADQGTLLIIEPGDQVRKPKREWTDCYNLTFTQHEYRHLVAAWLIQKNPLCRIFGADCQVREAHFYPDIVSIVVYIPV